MSSLPPDLPEYSERIQIRGLVQGVGLRPSIWQQARRLGINGEVRNDGSGVVIIAQSSQPAIEALVAHLRHDSPLLARVDRIEREVVKSPPIYQGFSIQHSISNTVTTGFVADAATCDECLADIFDPGNRRAGYAFTNCTHCGPRLSIANDIPYDRASTSMAAFTLCESCQAEYQSPHSRRFHAQPNACEHCGPRLQLRDAEGNLLEDDDRLSLVADLICQGRIIAIKGIGGFQLACNALDPVAVGRLRELKHRPHKPLALMAASIDQIMAYCQVSSDERTVLESAAAPIVLLERGARSLPDSIANGQPALGFMLPNSPLHHLLMRRLEAPIVLTSGNLAGQPQCIDNRQAYADLRGIADFFLLHDREIVNRVDDSVLRIEQGHTHFYRRARGYAPESLLLADDLYSPSAVLACGGELKNTFCLLQENRAILSPHIGDLQSARACDDFENSLALLRKLFRFDPDCIVVDMHPQYRSSRYGRELAAELGIALIEVQHHHAHIAACLADNGWSHRQGRVIGVALDGLGYGDDGSFWGGEIMLVDYCHYQRQARLKPVPMPGGSSAILEPWRNTYAQLQHHFDWQDLAERHADLPLFRALADKPLATLDKMIETGFNSPLTSACGRLFDAVAAALGICFDNISYQGQAAIELENCLEEGVFDQLEAYDFELGSGDFFDIDPAPMWQSLLQDIAEGVPVARISASFHLGLAAAIVDATSRIREHSGIQTVALSGGVFQNLSLLKLCRQSLEARGMKVLFHQQVPANDGGLALGQASIAAARIKYSE